MKHNMEFLLTFHSTSAAIAAERILLEAGAAVSVMPLPECISAGCGIALRLPGNPQDSMYGDGLDALTAGGVAVQAVYSRKKTPSGYEYEII